mmetsp:Transcript_77823/g.241136  ORF Transcript_77823/g.241136 Transcript_77823/m.241136 type:complete len:133 (+) Transcript_77823:2-400(+)
MARRARRCAARASPRCVAGASAPHPAQLNRELTRCKTVAGLLAVCRARASQFDAINMVTALHGIAKSRGGVEVQEDPAFVSLMGSLLASASSLQAQGICNTAWSLARLQVRDKPLLDALSAAARNLCSYTFR